jgi:triosephosphate isomerase
MVKTIVGNWKMYPTLSDSVMLAHSLKTGLQEIKGVEVVLAPPTPWLVSVIEEWKHSLGHIHFAAQNIWPHDQGAYTGETSAYFLKSLVRYAIIGHSERREHIGETNELVHEKVQACLRWQIKPIMCIGEEKKVLSSKGIADEYQWERLVDQLIEGLRGVQEHRLDDVIIAYEPVWAIGTRNPATPEYAAEVIRRLREKLAEKYSSKAAGHVKFLYGGSVEAKNAQEFLRQNEIDGLLVGSASVKSKEFIGICRAAAQTRT